MQKLPSLHVLCCMTNLMDVVVGLLGVVGGNIEGAITIVLNVEGGDVGDGDVALSGSVTARDVDLEVVDEGDPGVFNNVGVEARLALLLGAALAAGPSHGGGLSQLEESN